MPIPRGLKVTEFKQGDRVRVMGFEARVDYASSGQAGAAFIDLTTGDGNVYCVPRGSVELIPPRAEDEPVGSVRRTPTGATAVKIRKNYWAVLDETTEDAPMRWGDESAGRWTPTGEKILYTDR
jgi:hypothetical protein